MFFDRIRDGCVASACNQWLGIKELQLRLERGATGCREDNRTAICLRSCRMAMSRIFKALLGKENGMAKEERWAMTDVSREDVGERLGFEVTDAEWDEICTEVYEDAKNALPDVVVAIADQMECVNAPA